jgi:hypothetical protein
MIFRALLVAWLVLIPACAADPATRSPAIHTASSDISPQDVADRFRRALVSTQSLHITQRTFQNGRETLTSESWMTREAVRTDIYDQGLRVYSLAVNDTRAREIIPKGAVADEKSGPQYEEYILDTPHIIDHPRLISVGWACHVGNMFGTWLSSEQRLAGILAPRFETCTVLGTADVAGIQCAVLQWDEEFGDAGSSDSFRQGATYYLDLDRGWLLRADQYQQDHGARRISRTLILDVNETALPPAVFELLR